MKRPRDWSILVPTFLLACAAQACRTSHHEKRPAASSTSAGAIALQTPGPAGPAAAKPAAKAPGAVAPESFAAADSTTERPAPAVHPEPPAQATRKAELGAPAPDFSLRTLDGKTVKLSEFRGKSVVLEWFNPTCPYCVFAYSDEGPLHTLPERLMEDGVVWLSINSESAGFPGSKPEKNQEFVEARGMKAPLLLDTTGEVGQKYGAKSTPHCFVIDSKGVLIYRGALDNAPNGEVKGDTLVNYVEAALGDLAAGRAVAKPETKSYG